MTQTTPTTAIKSFAVLLLSFHAIATLSSMIPRQSYLARQLRPLFEDYQIATGTQQDWDMFTEIPIHRSYEIDIQATDNKDEVHTYGAILPGFEHINPSRTFRYHSMFARFTDPNYSRYVVFYSKQVARQLNQLETDRYHLRLFGFEIRSQCVSPLEEIRQGGDLTFPDVRSGGPWNLNH